FRSIRSNEVNVKRERLTQIVLVIVGLLNLALIYFLYMDLRHSSWLLEQKNEVEPMFLSFFIPVGVFLLIAARRPSEHRSMIALAAWWNISHSTVMAIQTVEAWNHGVHRNFTDVILFLDRKSTRLNSSHQIISYAAFCSKKKTN